MKENLSPELQKRIDDSGGANACWIWTGRRLFAGTLQDNHDDMKRKGRARFFGRTQRITRTFDSSVFEPSEAPARLSLNELRGELSF